MIHPYFSVVPATFLCQNVAGFKQQLFGTFQKIKELGVGLVELGVRLQQPPGLIYNLTQRGRINEMENCGAYCNLISFIEFVLENIIDTYFVLTQKQSNIGVRGKKSEFKVDVSPNRENIRAYTPPPMKNNVYLPPPPLWELSLHS